MSDEHNTGSVHEEERRGDEHVNETAPPEHQDQVPSEHQDQVRSENDAPVSESGRGYTVLPWRIGLFLLTSTIVQNLSYLMVSMVNVPVSTSHWSAERQNRYYQLCFNMIYLGPVFGLAVDLVRVFRERYRPVIIIACLVNAVLCFIAYGDKAVYQDRKYGSTIITVWLMEVAVMFVYMPMNAVVIWHGNRASESPKETSARIGGLMAQAMCWRTSGTLVSSIFVQYGGSDIPYRTHVLIAAIGSLVLIAQVLLLTKRSYYVDRRESSLVDSTPVRFYKSLVRISDNALSAEKKPRCSYFMFVLCFVFIYFMLPDALYNTLYSFNYRFNLDFSDRLTQTTNVLGSLGALVGAALYAIWMHLAYNWEKEGRGSLYRINPTIIMFAGCSAWAFGTCFHFIGQLGSNNESFSWKTFIPIQTFVVQACLRFAFMPTMSVAAMHTPRDYETAGFELYSVATTGGGTVSSIVTSNMASSMQVSVYVGYWKLLLLCVFFQYLPMLVAVTIPKYRDSAAEEESDDRIPFGADKEVAV